jgi:lipopolysaccharide transport system permease protein
MSPLKPMLRSELVARPGEPGTASDLEDATVREIVPTKWRLRLRDLPKDVPVVRVLAARDFKVKYKQSLLGPLWLVIQPLALLAAFLVAFRGLGSVGSSGVPYVAFALVGLSAWTFFQASMMIGATSVITNYGFVRFTPCPRAAFPFAAVIASLPSFGVTALGALVAAAVTGQLSLRVVLLPIGLVWLFLLTMGVVAIASSLAVLFRDIISSLPLVLQVGLFLAPIGYPLAELSPVVRTLVELNPLTGVIEALRWMVLSSYGPSIEPIAVSLATTLLLVVSGWRVFSRVETTMADRI